MLKPLWEVHMSGPECKHSDPRSRRTGVAFTVNMTPERVLGLSEEMQPTLVSLCIDSVPFYRCLLWFVSFGIATLRVIKRRIWIALKLSKETLKDHWVAPSPSMTAKNCFLWVWTQKSRYRPFSSALKRYIFVYYICCITWVLLMEASIAYMV